MVRYHWLLATFALLGGVYLTAIACDGAGGDETETGPVVSDELPSTAQGGTVPQDAFIVFEGQEYQAVAVTLEDTVDDTPDEFEEVGVVEESSVPMSGEVKVYRRENDEEAIYTRSQTADEGGAEANVRYRWVPTDVIVEPEGGGEGENEGEYDPEAR